MFAVKRAARRFDAMAADAFAADGLGFMEALVLAATFFEARAVKPSDLAKTFATTRGNVSHAISSLESKGLVQRAIDPADARGYLLTLKPAGRRCALRAISAFEKMQRGFEQMAGKTALGHALAVIRMLETWKRRP